MKDFCTPVAVTVPDACPASRVSAASAYTRTETPADVASVPPTFPSDEYVTVYVQDDVSTKLVSDETVAGRSFSTGARKTGADVTAGLTNSPRSMSFALAPQVTRILEVSATASSASDTTTFCGVLQFDVVKVSDDLSSVTCWLARAATRRVRLLDGCAVSRNGIVAAPPSCIVAGGSTASTDVGSCGSRTR